MSEQRPGRSMRTLAVASNERRGGSAVCRTGLARGAISVGDMVEFVFRTVLVQEKPNRLRIVWRHPATLFVVPLLIAGMAVVRFAILPMMRLKRAIENLAMTREVGHGR